MSAILLLALLLTSPPPGFDAALLAVPRTPVALRVLHGSGFLPRAVMTNWVITEARSSARAQLAAAGIRTETLLEPGAPAQLELYIITPGEIPAGYGRTLLTDADACLLLARPESAESLPPQGFAIAKVGTDRIVLPDPDEFVPSHAPGDVRLDWNPTIDSIVQRITPTELATLLRQLSGEVPVMVRGRPDTLRTRHTNTVRNSLAAWFLRERFESYGLDSVGFHAYSADSNVIAVKNGTTWPRKYLVIGGHFDNTSEQPQVWAPGADDNATGTVMALVAAKYLAPYRFRYTIRFINWNGEEQGLLGSAAHAQFAYNRGDTILGVLNGDMIAGNGTGLDSLRLYHGNRPGTVAMVDTLVRCLALYGIDLKPAIRTTMPANSDHYSYYTRGYNALMGIEDDFSPVYHSTGDRITDANFDTVYFCNVVRAYVATLATLAELGSVQDAGVTALVTPTGLLDSGAVVVPQARVRNCSPGPVTFKAFLQIGSVFRDSLEVTALAANAESTLTFREWPKPHPAGRYALRCTTSLPGDSNPDNNVLVDSFTVYALPTETGWTRKPDLPAGPLGRSVKDGGALAFGGPSEVFALKGNNTCEFYAYSPITNTWLTLESIPRVGAAGRKKGVKKGATLTAAGSIYAAKGNNSLEFWGCNPAQAQGPNSNSESGTACAWSLRLSHPWMQLADIPPGAKAVREGAGAAALTLSDTTYIYFLKGSGTTEFYRYNTRSGIWGTCPDAPLGVSGRPYKNGSTLASDGTATVYVLKGSYNELHAYDAATGLWQTRAMLPLVGSSGRKKKVKDGASIAFAPSPQPSPNGRGSKGEGCVFALKGGGTLEFWVYSADSDAWQQLPGMPAGAGRNVKAGGALVPAPEFNCLYALKGNRTNEFYKYGLTGTYGSRPLVGNVEVRNPVGAASLPRPVLRITPSPSPSAATIALSLPCAGSIKLSLYDAAGRRVKTLAEGYRHAGIHIIPLADLHLARGVYLLELQGQDAISAPKLVIE